MQLFRIPYNNNEMMKKVLVLVILSLLSTVASAGKIPHRRSPSTSSASAHEGDVIRFELGKLYLLVYHHRNLQNTHAFHGRPSLLVIVLICIYAIGKWRSIGMTLHCRDSILERWLRNGGHLVWFIELHSSSRCISTCAACRWLHVCLTRTRIGRDSPRVRGEEDVN